MGENYCRVPEFTKVKESKVEKPGHGAHQENASRSSLRPWDGDCSCNAVGVSPVGGQDAEASGRPLEVLPGSLGWRKSCPSACEHHPPMTCDDLS